MGIDTLKNMKSAKRAIVSRKQVRGAMKWLVPARALSVTLFGLVEQLGKPII
jgi:hypothetical protein